MRLKLCIMTEEAEIQSLCCKIHFTLYCGRLARWYVCVVYNEYVSCTVYSEQLTVHIVQGTIFNVKCTVYSVLCTVRGRHIGVAAPL